MCGPREWYGDFLSGGRDIACDNCCRGVAGAVCGHGWRTLKRGRDIDDRRDFRPFPPFVFFAAFQDDAAVFATRARLVLTPCCCNKSAMAA